MNIKFTKFFPPSKDTSSLLIPRYTEINAIITHIILNELGGVNSMYLLRIGETKNNMMYVLINHKSWLCDNGRKEISKSLILKLLASKEQTT